MEAFFAELQAVSTILLLLKRLSLPSQPVLRRVVVSFQNIAAHHTIVRCIGQLCSIWMVQSSYMMYVARFAILITCCAGTWVNLTHRIAAAPFLVYTYIS